MGFVQDNFFISSAIHPHQRLRTLLRSEAAIEHIEKAVSNLAVSIARMHDGGIMHRDLTSGNFLVDKEGRVYLTDLNRARHRDHLTDHQRLRDLARISFTMSDDTKTTRLAKTFFQAYGVESSKEANWEQGYWEYRQQRLKRRRLKLRFKRLLAR